jgi:hypothetical protein
MKIQTNSVYAIIILILCCFSYPEILKGQGAADTIKTGVIKKDQLAGKSIKSPGDLLAGFDSLEKGTKYGNRLNSFLPDEMVSDKRLDSVKVDAWLNYFRYMRHGYRHRANVFTWQLISSIIIFSMVICLVFIGIYFAWLQFRLALKEIEKGKEEDLKTEINVSPKEIKVSSPVLGVIILVISLLFFYLYLIYIYPIEEIF